MIISKPNMSSRGKVLIAYVLQHDVFGQINQDEFAFRVELYKQCDVKISCDINYNRVTFLQEPMSNVLKNYVFICCTRSRKTMHRPARECDTIIIITWLSGCVTEFIKWVRLIFYGLFVSVKLSTPPEDSVINSAVLRGSYFNAFTLNVTHNLTFLLNNL